MRCKRHPRYKQSDGVCPLCLSDKLFALTHVPDSSCSSNSTSYYESSAVSTPYSSSSDSISCYSSSCTSSLNSPMHCYSVGRNKDSNKGFWSRLFMRWSYARTKKTEGKVIGDPNYIKKFAISKGENKTGHEWDNLAPPLSL